MQQDNSYVVGFLHSFDLSQWLLIDKGMTQSKANTALKWCGIGGQIQVREGGDWAFKESNERFLVQKNDYAPLHHWHGKGMTDEEIKNFLYPRDFESPHAAMEREFLEEIGYKVIAKRWHCFHIKQYKGCKIYCFVCAASPNELHFAIEHANDIRYMKEGKLGIHQYVDVCFNPAEYTFDLRYLIPMIILENNKGMMLQLDPEGINSEFKATV